MPISLADDAPFIGNDSPDLLLHMVDCALHSHLWPICNWLIESLGNLVHLGHSCDLVAVEANGCLTDANEELFIHHFALPRLGTSLEGCPGGSSSRAVLGEGVESHELLMLSRW